MIKSDFKGVWWRCLEGMQEKAFWENETFILFQTLNYAIVKTHLIRHLEINIDFYKISLGDVSNDCIVLFSFDLVIW